MEERMFKDMSKDEINEILKVKHKTDPNTPLPYKGMSIRAEIASRIYSSVIEEYYRKDNNPLLPSIIDQVAGNTLRLTDALIKALNE